MKITFDKSVNAAYIYFDKNLKVDSTLPIDWVKWMVNIDVAKDWQIVWIEFIPATKLLPKKILDIAEEI